MLFGLLNWLGLMTPEQRARNEVTEIDRQVYDAEKSLHSARATLAYLAQRRDFLIMQYGFNDPPSSFDNLAALAPAVRKAPRKPRKARPATVQTITGPTADEALEAVLDRRNRH